MAATLDRLAEFGLDATISAMVWLSVWLPALVMSRQPARRTIVTVIAGVGSLAIPGLMALEVVPRIAIGGLLQDLTPPGVGYGLELERQGLIGADRPDRTVTLTRALIAAYGIGLGVQAARLLLGAWSVARLIGGSTAPSHGTASLYTWLCRDLGRVPRLRVSPRLRAPALFGTIRPVIVIPPTLDRAAHREALRLALLHELAHFQHRDPLAGQISRWSQAVWFFLPPVWWFGAQLRLDQEFLADHTAADGFGSPDRYAALLFERAGPQPERDRPGGMLGSAWLGGPALYQRLRMLLRCPFPIETIAPSWFRTVALLLGIPLVLGLSGISWTVEASTRPRPAPVASSYTLHRLRIGPQAQPRPEILPVPLGPEFDLSADFLASSPADLRGVRLAGYQLPDFDTESPDGRYTVHLTRRGGQARWQLGGREIPAGSSDDPGSAWLTITAAPNRSVEVRDLILNDPRAPQTSGRVLTPDVSPPSRSSLP